MYSDPLRLSYLQALLLNLMEPDFSNLIMNLISMALSSLPAPLVLASILPSSQHLFQPSEDSVDTSRYLNGEKGGVKRGATSLCTVTYLGSSGPPSPTVGTKKKTNQTCDMNFVLKE